jgi:hypothetical protein
MKVIQRAARLAAVALALAAVVPASHGQEQKASPAALLVAKQLVTVTGATALFNPLIAGVVEQAKLLYLQQNPSLGGTLNEIAEQMRKDLQPRFDELANEVARLYATHFTEKELKDILAFYTSPAGKKMLTEQPVVISASLKFAQDWANKLSEQVTDKMRDELKKKGHNL